VAGIIGTWGEGVAGGANAQKRFAGSQIRADRVEFVLSQCPAPDAQDYEVCVSHGGDETWKTMNVARALLDDGGAQPAPGQFFPGELRQGHPGFVFILADKEDDMR